MYTHTEALGIVVHVHVYIWIDTTFIDWFIHTPSPENIKQYYKHCD